MEIEDIKLLIKNELGYLPKGRGIDELLDLAREESYTRGQVIIQEGRKCPDIYIVTRGIVRFADMDGERERTFAFALPGSIVMSKHSFVMDLPSYYRLEACCDTDVLVVDRDDFWKLVERDHDMALWMLKYAYGECFYQEYKNASVHNGTAADRYRRMLADRPEITDRVPQKMVASYLGVTPEYLSKLKRDYFKPVK
ncbi:MAG: Crp/Fnr family transcriptional regulator [Muribaculaceae bacterium]|nr:Crp/Fnr family transcriptional regulator [Muribaculaceae bacterium]MDE5957973.1 Crp/Fnr family transcriptional regulator [Muribaculaceae bacterium]MDE6447523.1 Crp/Fnr family transcriptional regulator [Muribaculaceae bacterium]MDE7342416.1 Crp/Fnr family transcriptional regulator [Muribaculaceae bacterium]